MCGMVKPSVRRRRMSLAEFLRFENAHPERHEFVAGEVFAMSGGTLRHSRIIQNISFTLMSRMRGGPCEVHSNIVRVQVGDDRIYYPDVLVVCGRLPGDAQIVHEPLVIVEVTSPSTFRADRGDKLDGYRRLTSLETYLIVDSRRRRVDRHWRDRNGSWQWEQYLVEGSVPIPRPDLPLALDEIYEGVDLPRVSEPDMPEYDVEMTELGE
jgi:Uma2 family endonuclease